MNLTVDTVTLDLLLLFLLLNIAMCRGDILAIYVRVVDIMLAIVPITKLTMQ